MVIENPTAHLATVYRQGQIFLRNRVPVVHFMAPISEAALQWVERQFAAQPDDFSFQAAEAGDFPIPASPDVAEQALTLLLADELEMKKLVDEFHAIRSDVDRAIDALYDARAIGSSVIETVGE